MSNLTENLSMGKRRHVVILGAGASRATCPNGDRNGKQLPLMEDIIDILDLRNLLRNYMSGEEKGNFEEIYSTLNEHSDLTKKIETVIYDYFSSLKLPDNPTIYDFLLLSLRKKDVIATFNWDPFLSDAYARNYGKCDLPHLLFLHGNVKVGYCKECPIKGSIDYSCSRCGKKLLPTKLLYPIKKKDYHLDEFLSEEWGDLEKALEEAFVVTIFGYSAPETDVSAMEHIKKGWGDVNIKNLEQIEIVDLKTEDELVDKWQGLIHTSHYDIRTDFFDSWLARFPRRTCEAVWDQFMEMSWAENNIPIQKGLSFEQLYERLDPLISFERK